MTKKIDEYFVSWELYRSDDKIHGKWWDIVSPSNGESVASMLEVLASEKGGEFDLIITSVSKI